MNLHCMKNMGDNDIRPQLFYEQANPGTNGLYSKLTLDGEAERTWKYSDDLSKNLHHLPAANTLFINSNIALTDGADKKIGKSKTIPNLYDAIDTMATKINQLNNRITINGENITLNGGDITLNGGDINFKCKGFKKDGKETEAIITIQAIVEAIQELNRRTAYIDSTISFGEAVDYFDVHEEEIDGVYANKLDDGLPAATNSLHSGKFVVYHSANADCECPLEEAVEHNITGDNTPPTTGTNMKNVHGAKPIERGFDAEDDLEVITIENQSIRMRGCPYLML